MPPPLASRLGINRPQLGDMVTLLSAAVIEHALCALGLAHMNPATPSADVSIPLPLRWLHRIGLQLSLLATRGVGAGFGAAALTAHHHPPPAVSPVQAGQGRAQECAAGSGGHHLFQP